MITLALSKGRIFDDILPLLRSAGIEVLDDPEKSRKLILDTNQPGLRVVLVRATDVPTYVQYGGADLGVVGKDTCSNPAARACTSRWTCRSPNAASAWRCAKALTTPAAVRQGSRLKVATKYVAIARDFFATKGVHVDLIKLYGSMELAPLTGLADAIVDLVSTGSTLKANHLVEVERIMDISSHLVVNQTALKLKQAPIRKLIDDLRRHIAIPPKA
jgi:ATP phosphoribosyltransferase